MGIPAPVVLFVYNRPWHTRQTLEALHANSLSDQSELIVFSDGPKSGASPGELEKINEVRAVVQEKSWCKSVKLIKSVAFLHFRVKNILHCIANQHKC